jgi:hypothetical protein
MTEKRPAGAAQSVSAIWHLTGLPHGPRAHRRRSQSHPAGIFVLNSRQTHSQHINSTLPDRHQVHQARTHENPSRFRCSPRGNFARNALGVHHHRPARAAASTGGNAGAAAQDPAGRRAREEADHDATPRYAATPFTKSASKETRHKFMLELDSLDCFWWPDTPDGAARPTETRPPDDPHRSGESRSQRA